MSDSDDVVTVRQEAGCVLELAAGDLLPTYEAKARTCRERFDFTGWTGLAITLAGPVTVTGTATGDARGHLAYAWAAGDTDFPGDYAVSFRGISPSPESKPRTFPVQGIVRILRP